MGSTTRRAFLSTVGLGAAATLAAPSLFAGFGAAPGRRFRGDRLDFGALEPLATLMQETAPDDLMPKVIKRLQDGTSLRDVVAAAALANARVFGGEDYVGYHCAMALMPAWQMAALMSDSRFAPLPVLKVVYRNASRIQQFGGTKNETLKPVEPAASGDAASLVDAERKQDVALAERLFASIMKQGDLAAFEATQALVRDNIDVHQVVLAWRAWDILELTGHEHAHVMLRQSLRHCVDRERGRIKGGNPVPGIRELLPRLLEEHRLDSQPAKRRDLDDDALEKLSRTIFVSSPDDAARAATEALAAGSDPDAVGEAISLASVRLLLHDRGPRQGSPGKPAGSVHGASVGVHASDSAGAWRGIARVGSTRTRMASLITGAWHTAGPGKHMNEAPFHAPDRERAAAVEPGQLLAEITRSIRERAQGPAAALVERYGALDRPAEPLINLLLESAVAYDGALHHEKYFRTAVEGFQTSRPKFRWVHLTALARVCASGFGFEAQGLAQARRLLETA